MIGLQSNDICYSSIGGGDGRFSSDGIIHPDLTREQARSALDFNIVKKENFDVNGRLIPGQWHLEKDSDGSIIPSLSVGDRFEPIQHYMVFDYIVDKVLPHMKDARIIVSGTIHGGGVGIVIVQIGDPIEIRGDESPTELLLIFNNPSNGMGRMTLGMTAMRMLCLNQVVAALHNAGETGLNVMHTKSGKEIAAFAMKTISDEVRQSIKMKERIDRLSMLSVDTAIVQYCLDRVYPLGGLVRGSRTYRNIERLRQSVIEEFEAGETGLSIKDDSGWKLFNSFTHAIFNPKRMRKNMDPTEIQYSGMFGDRANSVSRIFNVVESAFTEQQ